MKRIFVLFILVIIMIGAVGCMNNINNGNSKYETDILQYLEGKYNEKFVIEKMVRQTDIGHPSVIFARTYSEKYPYEYFDAVYHLPENDITMKEEAIAFFKKVGVYDESNLKPETDDNSSYIEDNYCNVVLQNTFDKSHEISDAVFTKTIFETTNYYPSINGEILTVDEYIEALPCSLYACTLIFVEDDESIDKEAFVQKVVDKLIFEKMARQFIYIHYTDKSPEFIEEELKKHYDEAVMYFKDAEYVTDYEDVFIRKGIIQND